MDNETTPEMHHIFKETYKIGDDLSLEVALKKLKDCGCSQMQSLKVLMIELNMGLKEADNLVLNSETWFPERANNLQFRDEFWSFIKSQDE